MRLTENRKLIDLRRANDGDEAAEGGEGDGGEASFFDNDAGQVGGDVGGDLSPLFDENPAPVSGEC